MIDQQKAKQNDKTEKDITTTNTCTTENSGSCPGDPDEPDDTSGGKVEYTIKSD